MTALTVLVVPAASSQWLTNGTSIYYNGGKVGIGTSTPTNALHVVDPVNQGVGIFQNPNGRVGLGVDGSGGYLQADGIDFSFFAGSQRVLFGSSTSGRVGIGTTSPSAKMHIDDTTSGVALRAVTSVPNGAAIIALVASPTSSANFGIYADSGAGYGSVSLGKFGAYGASDIAAGAAIKGVASGGALAGRFEGNVQITGSISKGSGTFKIDHPLDPENKYLYHSFVESPDMMNIYNGSVVLDASGNGVITMPAYFEALNREFQYQLTCLGGYSPVYVASEINGNQFVIAGGRAGLKVSWQVTGIRRDAYAEMHRVQVEEDKSAEERGFYLHPEAFGKSTAQSLPSMRMRPAEQNKSRSRR